jgi:hypothetical protein
MEVFSTIASPVFSELVMIIEVNMDHHSASQVGLFETLRKMSGVRSFKLVFLLVGPEPLLGEVRRKLADTLDLVTARGLLDFLDSPPTIRSERYRKQW